MVKKVVLALLIIGILIFGIKKVTNNKVVKNDNNNLGEIKNKNSVLTEEEKEKNIEEMKIALENKTDKEILAVNGEKITEKELAFLNYQLNNSIANESGEKKDTVAEIIEDYAIYKDARELNIIVTNEEIANIENKVKSDKTVNNLAEKLDMDYDEVCEISIKSRIHAQIEKRWLAYVTEKIDGGEIRVDNEEFRKKYKEYSESKDISKRTQLLSQMMDMYKKYLVDKATIEYID